MSTRSIIAIQTGDTWKGRYCHSDGYPTWQVRQLLTLIQRDGIDAVRQTVLADHKGWDYLNFERPDLTGVEPDENAAHGSPAFSAYEMSSRPSATNVPGYGVTLDVDAWGEAWFTAEDNAENDGGAEWLYVLTDREILVYDNSLGGHRLMSCFNLLGRVAFDQDPEAKGKLAMLECGVLYERCSHYAWAHFPEAEGTRVGTAVWLGNATPGVHDATKFVLHGREVTPGGSSCTGSATDPDYWRHARELPKVRYHWSTIVEHGGRMARIARMVKAGYKLEVDLIVPTAAGNRVVTAGTVVDR